MQDNSKKQRIYAKGDKKNMNEEDTKVEITKHPEQMTIFEVISCDKTNIKKSQTVAIYDLLPKYDWNHPKIREPNEAEILKKDLSSLGFENCVMEVTPAFMELDDGKRVMIYPSAREEKVEDALRAIAANSNHASINQMPGVEFTIYQLEQELINKNCRLNYGEIREALLILSKSSLLTRTQDGKRLFNSPFLPLLVFNLGKDVNGAHLKSYASFHPLIANAITEKEFREINYEKSMGIRSDLARWFYKYLNNRWLQVAQTDKGVYRFSSLNLLEKSPQGIKDGSQKDFQTIRRMLKELGNANVIEKEFIEEKKMDGRKIADLLITISPTQQFVQDMVDANRIQKAKKINKPMLYHYLVAKKEK